MADLTREDVLKLAKLARLTLSDDEVEKFTHEISEILGYVEQLQGVKLHGEEPTYQVTGLKNVMRPDVVHNYGPDQKALLQNVPAVKEGLIQVKRVL